MINRRSFLKAVGAGAITAVVPLPFVATGHVPCQPSLTYSEWLKKQSVEFQDDVLGRTRGQLFRRCEEITFGEHPTNKRTVSLNQKIWEAYQYGKP